MAFSYPTILLAENPTAGFATFPHHVWTTAKPLEGEQDRADVEMRQVWIHGSYMKVLEKDVLNNALDIQQKLVGGESLSSMIPALDSKLQSSTLDWGYHSPLMYWNNSHAFINGDQDLLRTVNDKARSTYSQLNVALRPASVFAGKKFVRAKLVAADALVITLMNKVKDGIGDEWRERMSSLTTGACEGCTLYPHNGHVTRNRVYEFSITPLTLKENIALTIAYSFMALYVLLSLRRMKAFHSRFGLVVTAITQMTCSILASFTICGLLKINLSMIPQNAYPFVVLVLGIENMFRVINAVVAYPATMATELRIANALGDVGPVSVATAAQNLLILSLLSRMVSPGVAAFCVFACIAALFDAFFLLTFFIAVLNVDIRRFELQDALARANQTRHRRKPSPAQHNSWFDALVHGRLPFSTRMAGTAVTTTFILSLNYHFFEHKEKATSIRHLLRLIKNGPPMLNEFDSFAPPPINASLTPGQWMRMQDFDTAKEVMRLAKPGADSFIVRVFAPLIIVLPGADRTDMDEEEAWTSALRAFAVHHFYPVAVAVVFAVAFVAVLMNFLLYMEHEDEPDLGREEEEKDAIKVTTVGLPHRLDIVKMCASHRGGIATIGLDRTVAITTLNGSHHVQRLSSEALAAIHWPIHSMAMDDSCEWLAFHCADDQILLYSTARTAFASTTLTYPDDNPPVLLRFMRLPGPEGNQMHFIVVTSGGRLAMANIDTNTACSKRLEDGPLLGAALQELSSQGRRLLIVTDQAQIVSYTWTNGELVAGVSQILPVPTTYGRLTGAVRIEQDPGLGNEVLVVTTTQCIVFVDAQTLAILGRVCVEADEPPISGVIIGQGARCPYCASPALRCIGLVSDGPNETQAAITTVWPQSSKDAVLCLRSGDSACEPLNHARREKHKLDNPGAWSLVSSQAILGLRKPIHQQANGSKGQGATSIRNRKARRVRTMANDDEDPWEAYKFSLDGDLETVEVLAADTAEASSGEVLYVSSPGPTIAVDSSTVAVAFGNVVKVLKSTWRGSLRRPTGRTLERQGEEAL